MNSAIENSAATRVEQAKLRSRERQDHPRGVPRAGPGYRLGNVPRRYNAAPSQELLVIRQKHKAGERSLALIKWGLALLPESLHRAKLGAGCIRLLE
jgi:putative SOS response-associated peptidase YedK